MSDAFEQPTSAAQHRLVDMVVEEVSLVDRAANKRKFLVIKRSGRTDMANTGAGSKDRDQMGAEAPAGALEALEGVAKAVANLAEVATSDADTARVIALATQVAEVAKGILDPEAEHDPEQPNAEAAAPSAVASAPGDASPAGAPSVAPPAPSAAAPAASGAPPATDAPPSLEATFGRIEAMLRELRLPAPAGAPSAAAAPKTTPSTTEGQASAPLGKLIESLEKLSGEVRAQGQRLGRLEKGVGLPGSQMDERGPRARESPSDEVSWPLDLNEKLDRASVEKRVSFHDD